LGARALLGYAKALTETPQLVDDETINTLRAAGLSEHAIYEATELIAFFNFTGRAATVISCGWRGRIYQVSRTSN